ncbi:MAG: glycosyltransferase family 4 protein [Deltaproteobacteria bacterium]|nr:glycosyltransferase family 4 protein [Deltaproteobacteria bacterium]
MKKNRILIDYQTIDKPWGGSNSFIAALKEYLSSLENVELTSDKCSDQDLLLLNTAYTAPGKYISLRKIERYRKYGYSSLFKYILNGFKKNEIKIVLRLDGLRQNYADTPETKGDIIQLALIKLADAIIFQSNESVNQFNNIVENLNSLYYVVHNGVNQNIFNMEGKTYWNKKDKLKIFATSWSKNLNKGFEEISKFSQYDEVIVNFVGNWPEEVNPGKVHRKPPMPQHLLAEEYRKNDVFLFPSRGEACPNVVYEALSCGLPVMYHPSGGTPEIASRYGIELGGNLSESIDKIANNYDNLMANIKKDHIHFSISYAGDKYLKVMQKVLKD